MQRKSSLLREQQFDLLVCGGGIYGAWAAYDAALRGLKVALIDRGDWAGGTSSASSKLIHGGLRYLENFDFRLVKKSLLERQMLLQTAPHRVWPLRFGIPIYRHGRLNGLKIKLGLALYDWLAGVFSDSQAHRQFSRAEFTARFPYLNSARLIKGFTYADAQTDDARFVLELIDGALAAGAICVNYCEASDLTTENGRISGVLVLDQAGNKAFAIQAEQVVDTTGRWSSKFQEGNLRLAKGIHLLMPGLEAKEALLLTAQADGRVFFIIPWYGLTLVGTTDTDYDGDPDTLPINDGEIDYLLTETNRALTSINWSKQDIIGAYAGVRVLKAGKEGNPSAASRDWALVESPSGLLSSIGGKFTSAREDASVIVDTVCAKLNRHLHCRTFGKAFPWLAHTGYQELLAQAHAKAAELGIDGECVLPLARRYGERIEQVFELCAATPHLGERIKPDLTFIKAELIIGAEEEMVVHLDDLLRRRLPLLILTKLSEDDLEKIGQLVAPILGWNKVELGYEIERCLSIVFKQ